jgi:hypothetical protein
MLSLLNFSNNFAEMRKMHLKNSYEILKIWLSVKAGKVGLQFSDLLQIYSNRIISYGIRINQQGEED